MTFAAWNNKPLAWSFEVLRVVVDDEHGSLVSAAGGYITFESCMENAVKDALYYRSIGYAVNYAIRCYCRACAGLGTRQGKRKTVRCPECLGCPDYYASRPICLCLPESAALCDRAGVVGAAPLAPGYETIDVGPIGG